jgi:type II secretory pathway pseudopilin PulG
MSALPSRRGSVVNRKAQGFALIDLVFVCGIIGVLCSVAVPRMLLAKQSAGAASAIASMRVIDSAELTYALTCGGGFYAPNLTTLGAAPPASHEPFIGGGLGLADAVTKSGYTIQVVAVPFAGAPGACNGLAPGEAGQGFRAGADPIETGNVRFFGTNSQGTIYEHTSSLFATMPELGESLLGHPLR